MASDTMESLRAVAELNQLAQIQKQRRNYTDARLLYERAIAKLRSTTHERADLATLIGNLALLHRELRAYDEARRLYTEVLQIRRETLGEKHPSTQATLGHIAELEAEDRQYDRALEHANVLLEMAGDDPDARFTALHRIATVQYQCGDYASAVPVLEQLLHLVRGHTTFHAATHSILNNLGLSYLKLGELDRARSLLVEALDLVDATGEGQRTGAETMLNLGDLHARLSQRDDARAWYDRAIMRARANGNTGLESSVLIAISKLERSMNLAMQAMATARKAVDLARSTDDREATLKALQALGSAQTEAGRYAEAESTLREAHRLARRIDGGARLDAARIEHDLGCVLHHLGQHADARLLLDNSLRLKRQILAPDHPEIAMTLGAQAVQMYAARDYPGAIRVGEAAVEIMEAIPEAERPEYGWILHNVAMSYSNVGRTEDALRTFRAALERLVSAHGPHSVNVALAQMNLAVLLSGGDLLKEARALLSAALETIAEVAPDRVDDYVVCATNLASIASQMGDVTEAERLYDHAIQTLDAQAGATHPLYADVLVQLAVLYLETDRQMEALDLLHASARQRDRLLVEVFASSSEAQRLALADGLRTEMLAVVSVTMMIDRRDDRLLRAAADLVLRRKGISAEAVTVQREASWEPRHEETSRKLKDLHRLRQRIAARYIAASKAAQSREDARELARWEEDREALERSVSAAIPRVTMDWQLRSTDTRAVARALPPGTVLIELLRVPALHGIALHAASTPSDFYAAIVVHADEEERVEIVSLGDAKRIDELTAEFIDSVASASNVRDFGRAAPRKKAGRNWKKIGHELRSLVFDPVLRHIGNAGSLMIAADGDLSRLPLDVLPLDQHRLIIDDYRVSYLSAGRDALRLNVAPNPEAGAPLVVADPDFDLGGDPVAADPTVRAASRQAADLNRSGNLVFTRLPGTREEGRRIASLLNVEPLMGDQALEATIKARESPRILHIATHGFFLPDAEPTMDAVSPQASTPFGRHIENPMLRSGLALAGANTWLRGGTLPEAAEDALLNGEDVCGLELAGTELVVLSACETGLGRVHVGEGVFGLRRAFMLAGARTLIISLWKVPDQHTQELMDAFYTKLISGAARGEALRQARLELRSRYPDPFYWGAFICQGDPRALNHPPS